MRDRPPSRRVPLLGARLRSVIAHRRWLALAVAAFTSAIALAALAAGASAFFTAGGHANASIAVGSMTGPGPVVAQAQGANVQITWSAATLASGAAVQGYTVTRSDSRVVCGQPALVTTLTCTDTSATTGSTYTYTVTAVYHTFTESSASEPITVLTAPTLGQTPPNPSAAGTATFSFTGGGGTGYQCRLDGGAFTACTSPDTLSGLSDGSHTFAVEAAGGADTGPATSDTWLVDTTAPTSSLALAAGASGAYLSGTTLYYRGSAAGSFSLIDTVTDGGSGPASAAFPAIATTGWTHGTQTVSSGSGTPPAISYTSSPFSWSANPSAPSGYAITATDAAGNAAAVTPTFVSDTTAPAGGAITVAGTAATAGGAAVTTGSAAFTIAGRTDYADGQSGLSASVLTVQSETLSASVCGAAGFGGPFTTATTIGGTTQPSGIVAGYCYLYTLTGTDNVGNTASVSVTVALDTSPAVSSASPSALGQGATSQTVVIAGSGFVSGATASFGSGVTVNSTTFNSASQLTVNVTVGAGAGTGSRSFTIANPDGGSATGSFTVDTAPAIASVSPSTLDRSVTSQTVTITGTGFTSGTALAVAFAGTGITVASPSVVNSTTITAKVTVSAAAPYAVSALTVTNGDAGVGTCSACFGVFHYATSVVGGTTATSGTSVSSALTLAASTTYIIAEYSKSSAGDSAAVSISSAFTGGNPTISAIGSQQDYDASTAHMWLWYLTGGSGSGTIKVTMAKATTQADMGIIAITGASAANPIVTGNVGVAVSGGTAASTTTSNPATVALPSAPGGGDYELSFWSCDTANGASGPASSSTYLSAVSGVYTSAAAGTVNLYSGDPLASTVSLTQSAAMHWGTLTLELRHQ